MAEHINKTDTLNEGRVKLNAAISDAESAKVTAEGADVKSTQALANSESTQTQLDTIVIEGDSSVEAAQARVDEKGEGHATLKARIDGGFEKTSSRLADKASKNDLQQGLLPKADQSFVDAQLSSIVSGAPKGTYANLQALEDAHPNGEEGIFLVLSDGHWYYWNAELGNWADGGLYNALEIQDESISFVKQSFLSAEKKGNLFNGVYQHRWIQSSEDPSVALGEQFLLRGGRVALVPISKNKTYLIETTGTHDRFVLSLLKDDKDLNELAKVVYALTPSTGNESFRIFSGDYKYLAVGVSSSGEEPELNITSLNSSFSLSEASKVDVSNSYVKKTMNTDTGEIITAPHDRSFIIQAIKGSTITIKTYGVHDRFAVGGLADYEDEKWATPLYKGKSGDGFSTGDEEYSFKNINYNFIIVNISTSGIKPKVEFTEVVETSVDSQSISGEDLEDNSVPFSKQNFLKVEGDSVTVIKGERLVDASDRYLNKWVNFESGIMHDVDHERSVVYEIPRHSDIKIETFGNHNRFTVSLAYNLTKNTQAHVVYTGLDGDGTSTGNETYSLENTDYRYIIIGITTGSAELPLVSLNINEKGISLKSSSEATSSATPKITTENERYPVLFGVKMSNAQDFSTVNPDNPRPIGWLYYTVDRPQKILYASGDPSNMEFLCYWNEGATWNGTSSPEWYRPFITREGDIIFVWRGDSLGLMQDHPDSRQNPIVYPANDWDNPIEVELVGGVKPTSWLQNCGADYIYNQDVFIFSEYTRPHHKTANVWRVTKPFTDPSNWEITQTLELSGSNQTGMKHYHTSQYDTFSGMVYTTTGDDDEASKIYSSSDYGITWEVVYEGNRRHARVLNFAFTKEGAYWANDDGNHGFFFAPRNGLDIVDFTQIEELYDLSEHPPTYVNVLVDDPYGILILHRWDGVREDSSLIVHYWDIETSTMHEIKNIKPVNENSPYGFRVEAINFYQSRGDNSIVAGFAEPYNNMDLLNNYGTSNETRINNLVLKVVRDGNSFDLKVSAISDRS